MKRTLRLLWRHAGLWPFLGVSVLLHMAVASLLPKLPAAPPPPPEPEPYAEVSLLPVAMAPQPPPEGEALAGRPGGFGGEADSFRPASSSQLASRAAELRSSSASEAASSATLPMLDLPESGPAPAQPLRIPSLPEFAGELLPGPSASPRAEAGDAADLSGLESELEQARPGRGAPDGLQGPAAARTVLERPPLPELDVSETVVLRMRFWVLPSGAVGEVFPLQKADAALERRAAEYLRRWRFNALPPGGEKVWGEITIRFRPA